MVLFLHKNGYNFFNLGRLTYGEINFLVDAWNREQESKKREYERKKSKYKR